MGLVAWPSCLHPLLIFHHIFHFSLSVTSEQNWPWEFQSEQSSVKHYEEQWRELSFKSILTPAEHGTEQGSLGASHSSRDKAKWKDHMALWVSATRQLLKAVLSSRIKPSPLATSGIASLKGYLPPDPQRGPSICALVTYTLVHSRANP